MSVLAVKTVLSTRFRRSIFGIYAGLITANVLAWAWAVAAFHDRPILLGTAFLAYSFGLRHAVDADHIAAIDNVTRKLMQSGQRPVAVGLWFALGHSAVVFVAAGAVALTTAALQDRFAPLKAMGGVVGTGVSALFLFAIAAANIVILRGVWRSFQHVRRGGALDDTHGGDLLAHAGPLTRLFRPIFGLITRSWHMVPLGFLFGLGFDTATEVTLLGISATQATQGQSMAVIMVFPVLFAAGMSLIDMTDGLLMLGAYEWAFMKPLRKLYYNLTITLASVLVAVLVGGIETLGLLSETLGLTGPFWDAIAAVNEHFEALGFAIVGFFVVAWAGSALMYRLLRLDAIEEAP